MTAEPGSAEEASPYCDVCDSACDGFDHHCALLGACIGHHNRRAFVAAFGLGAIALTPLGWGGALGTLESMETPYHHTPDGQARTAANAFFAALFGLLGMASAVLALIQWAMLSLGLTVHGLSNGTIVSCRLPGLPAGERGYRPLDCESDLVASGFPTNRRGTRLDLPRA